MSRGVSERIGPYEVLGELARGGMGVVYRARDPHTGREVALKLLLGPTSPGDEELERFRVEALAWRRLEHPHVVPVLGSGADRGRPYLVLELVRGPTLWERIRRGGPLPVAEAVRISGGIACAVAHAHARGVLHRDVKPQNVLLREPDRHPLLADFGLARLSGERRLTATGDVLGTPAYMAPEQARGDPREVGPPADVYGVGATLYTALTGRPPFEGDNALKVLAAVVEEAPVRPSLLRPDLDPALERLCLQALAKAPTERPTASALAAALAAWRPAPPSQARLAAAALVAAAVVGGAALALAVGERRGALPVAGASDRTEAPGEDAPTPPPVAAAEHVLRLQPGPLEGRDTFVSSDGLYINDNFGADTYLRVGRRLERGRDGTFHTLIAFSLDRLPADAEVRAAHLVLQASPGETRDPDRPLPLVIGAIAESGRRTPWVEGTSTNDAVLDGVAWDAAARPRPGTPPDPRFYSGRPELSRPDVEEAFAFGTDAPGVAARGTLERSGAELTVDVTVLVRAWATGALPNHGLWLAPADGTPVYRLLYSSDAGDPAKRPALTVRYVGAPPLERPGRSRDAARAAAEEHLAEARRALERRAWDEAVAEASRAAREAPFLGHAYAVRGRALAADLATLQAAQDDLWRAAVVVEPTDDPEDLALCAELRLGLGYPEERALELLGRALELRPDDPDLRALRALALLQQGDTEAAVRELDLAFDGDGRRPRRPLAHRYYGERLLAQGRLHEALEVLEDAPDGVPAFGPVALQMPVDIALLRGQLHLRQGRAAEARAAWDEGLDLALDAGPAAFAPRVVRAVAELDREEARRLLDRGRERHPHAPQLPALADELRR